MTNQVDARALVRRSFIEPPPLQRYIPGDVRTESRCTIAFVSLGDNGSEDNYVVVFGPITPAELLAQAKEFFGSEDFAVSVESDTNDELEEWLQASRWNIDEEEPQMILVPVHRVERDVTELEVKLVETEEQYEDFMQISETGRRWVPSLQAATDPDVALLVGYVAGKAVATSRLSCLGDLGNILGVVTRPEFRRRGYGTEMTWAATNEAVERGCKSVTLGASEMGFPVYRRMGFVTVCNYRTYVRSDE